MFRALTVISLLVFTPVAVGAEYHVSESPAPGKYVRLDWKHGELTVPGYWYTSEQVQRIDLRITELEINAAKKCVDAQISANASRISSLVWITAGLLVGGLVTWQSFAWYNRAHPSSTIP